MTTPDPQHSIQYGPPDAIEEQPSQNLDVSQELDPIDALLAEDAASEIDDERLYTDEFIRANENAARSLFLGFLGLALLVTSVLAWLVLSRPQDETETEPPSSPVTVPSSPPETIPDLRLDVDPTSPSDQVNPGTSNEVPQDPSLVFPATPVIPNASSPPATVAPESSENSSVEPLPQGTVPPPPPVNP